MALLGSYARLAKMALSAALLGAAILTAAHATPPSAMAKSVEEEPAKPEDIALKTDDGLSLAATFYPSKLGKDAVAVVLVHSSKGTRGDFVSLALVLQRAGHAVIVPDLRGHGDSAHPVEHTGDLRPADYVAMVEQDLETVKRF
ncbi:MAG TPA: hypothetical protein VHV08_13290, partial [Pirellulales bacterium]|nr:hypothetical protein [Pirellulales bacterium]